MKEHFELLGYEVEDVVTKTRGVVTSISLDLYGCIMAIVTSPVKDDGKVVRDWYDVKRLRKIGKAPVMAVPNFGQLPEPERVITSPQTTNGPEEKPDFSSLPIR